ncbi:hypothetical protein NPIL_612161 [Nephila pilipes]|uniref:C2H2-type domain-containing protein n=1 Tax=Nephila pilipes TaxID=299642 RepID=A0A8X6PSX1_NEPPI|nr:hypothetical protein NPIL_612161 [Nephila pilipes]
MFRLTAHLDLHKRRQVRCEFCNMQFSSEYSCKEHQNVHMNTVSNRCEMCKQTFKDKYDLLYHMSIHSDKRFSCIICNKSFIRKAYLRKHGKIHLKAVNNPKVHFVTHKWIDCSGLMYITTSKVKNH